MGAYEQDEVLPGMQISFSTLAFYLLLYLVPLIVAYFFSSMIGGFTAEFLQVSKETAAKIYMVPLSMILFAFLIPYIRNRESVQAIRFTIIAVLVVGVGLAIPPIVKKGDYALIHVGFTISLMDEEEAQETLKLIKEVSEFENEINTSGMSS